MRKQMIGLLSLIILFAITSCSTSTNLQWFENENMAIQYGMEQEGILKEDIFGKFDKDGEIFVVYKKQVSAGLIFGVANIGHKDGQFSWYKAGSDVLLKEMNGKIQPPVTWEITTYSGKEFSVYAEMTDHYSEIYFQIE